MRRILTAVLGLAAVLSLMATATNEYVCVVTQADPVFAEVVCQFPHTGALPERTVDFSRDGPLTTEIDGNHPCRIWQGWQQGPTPCLVGLDSQGICDFACEHFRFELRINGQPVPPEYVTVGYVKASTEAEQDLLGPIFAYYEFPAGCFAAGIYVFEGTWRIVDLQCSCTQSCDETDPPVGSFSGSSQVTISIVY